MPGSARREIIEYRMIELADHSLEINEHLPFLPVRRRSDCTHSSRFPDSKSFENRHIFPLNVRIPARARRTPIAIARRGLTTRDNVGGRGRPSPAGNGRETAASRARVYYVRRPIDGRGADY